MVTGIPCCCFCSSRLADGKCSDVTLECFMAGLIVPLPSFLDPIMAALLDAMRLPVKDPTSPACFLPFYLESVDA